MGAVAREYGFKGVFFPELTDPETGLEYACRLLANLLSRYSVEDAVSAYNAGSPTQRNERDYVQPVLRWAAGYKAVGL
ncbi:MAG TPA: transglycosylase SLT domain-containing protein [Spirochaetia bacterium]|nr:transglycosylase SLT domain-containing protein [Spirochaetia bacterium]